MVGRPLPLPEDWEQLVLISGSLRPFLPLGPSCPGHPWAPRHVPSSVLCAPEAEGPAAQRAMGASLAVSQRLSAASEVAGGTKYVTKYHQKRKNFMESTSLGVAASRNQSIRRGMADCNHSSVFRLNQDPTISDSVC